MNLKIKSKRITNLNISPETISYIEENISSKLMDLGVRKGFLNLTPKAREVKAKINKWDSIKLKSIFTAKDSSNKTKRQQPNGRRYLLSTAPTRG